MLKKYRDFGSSSADFPLREFRSRHSAATEAVGYGKTLMGPTCCASRWATRSSSSSCSGSTGNSAAK